MSFSGRQWQFTAPTNRSYCYGSLLYTSNTRQHHVQTPDGHPRQWTASISCWDQTNVCSLGPSPPSSSLAACSDAVPRSAVGSLPACNALWGCATGIRRGSWSGTLWSPYWRWYALRQRRQGYPRTRCERLKQQTQIIIIISAK